MCRCGGIGIARLNPIRIDKFTILWSNYPNVMTHHFLDGSLENAYVSPMESVWDVIADVTDNHLAKLMSLSRSEIN